MPSDGLGGASWLLYVLRCGDGTLYTGVTTDLTRRLRAHARGRGARYTRGRGPLAVVHVEEVGARGEALRREHAWKRLPRAAKELAIARAAAPSRGRGSAARTRRSAGAGPGRR